MKLTFLSADKPLTKTYMFNETGLYDSIPYPLTASFTSHEEEIETIEDMLVQIGANGKHNRCLLRGNLERPLQRESRAGITLQEASSWLLLDFDGFDLKNKTLDQVLAELGLDDVDYILQYSSSHLVKSGLNAHVFMLLDRPYPTQDLKQWVKHKNLSLSIFRDQIHLTKSNMALHWCLDITVNQPDKLIYIATPFFIGKADPIAQRLSLIKKNKRYASLHIVNTALDNEANDLVKQLRSAKGLPVHNLKSKYIKRDNTTVLDNPDKASVTGVKRNGVFTYLNLNGGDSWGYFHLTASPDYLFNFKGEPIYKLQEIAPDYYSDAVAYSKQHKLEEHIPEEQCKDIQHFVINRKDEGRYYKVIHDPQKGIELNPAPTAKHIADFCILKKIPIPEIIDDWSLIFDPTTNRLVDTKEKTLNMLNLTSYRFSPKKSYTGIPEIYMTLFKHVCGDDEEVAYRFINWLAYIWQTGKKPKTAWVLHGNYGTGKGRVQRLLAQLFGSHCITVSPENINEQFNALIERAQILWIDEVTTDSWDNERITPKLRNWITEDTITIRGMRKDYREVPNFMGIIIAANEHNPVEIRFGDRRWNVCPRQETKITSLPWGTHAMLDNEAGFLYQPENLTALASALYAYPVDDQLVSTPIENDAKLQVMQVTQNLPEDIVQALQQGNISYFLEHIDTLQVLPSIEAAEYKQVVSKMMRGGRVPLATREIAKIFEYLAGWKQAPGKFSKAVSKFGLMLAGKVARDGNKTFAGTYFNFNVTDQDRAFWAQITDHELRLVKNE